MHSTDLRDDEGPAPAPSRATLSVAIITFDEEANLGRTLASVAGLADEIVVLDSGSTDRTPEIARSFRAHLHTQTWGGFAVQKNAAIARCTCDWVLSLDADEEVSPELRDAIRRVLAGSSPHAQFAIPRRNFFLGRPMRHGGFYPDPKVRLFRRGMGSFENRAVHETVEVLGTVGTLRGDLLHHAYPTLTDYIEHMNRYSTLGAEHAAERGKGSRGALPFVWNVLLNPLATFFYNYVLRLGFLDGREGLLLHLYHSAYVSWKYAKAWEREAARAARSYGKQAR